MRTLTQLMEARGEALARDAAAFGLALVITEAACKLHSFTLELLVFAVLGLSTDWLLAQAKQLRHKSEGEGP